VSPPTRGFFPADIHIAYGLPAPTVVTGSGVIAIVDAFDSPTSLNDFNVFSAQFGLPLETSTNPTAPSNNVFQVVYQNGIQPATDLDWAGEISLDIEWAHAMAPGAKIVLFEAASSFSSDLDTMVQVASNYPGVKQVSMSFGSNEFLGESASDFIYSKPGVNYFASTGDVGGIVSYPAISQNVIGVGGTSLTMNVGKTAVVTETGWTGSGGGLTAVSEPAPLSQLAYTNRLVRSNPDVAAIADPATGCAFYDTTGGTGWGVVGGTSLACPVFTGILNSSNFFQPDMATLFELLYLEFPADANLSPPNPSAFRDITTGTAGSFTAGPGYDLVTGIGVPNGLLNSVVASLHNLPKSVVKLIGSKMTGTVTKLSVADSDPVIIVSQPVLNVGQVATAEADYRILQPATLLDSWVLSSSLNADPVPNGAAFDPKLVTMQVLVYNFKFTRWDLLKAFPSTGAFVASALGPSNFPEYMDAHGLIKVKYQAIFPQRLGAIPFEFSMDLSNIDVTLKKL
jgi:kumamolisin